MFKVNYTDIFVCYGDANTFSTMDSEDCKEAIKNNPLQQSTSYEIQVQPQHDSKDIGYGIKRQECTLKGRMKKSELHEFEYFP